VSAVEQPSLYYRVRIRGHLDPAWSSWLHGLVIVQEQDGTTTLTGPLVDQAALYGLLNRLRDLGGTLLAVEHLGAEGANRATLEKRS
jgi:hypothetical protein